jgi:hypothetical protein
LTCVVWADISGKYAHADKAGVTLLTVMRTGQALSGYIDSVSEDLNQSAGYVVKHGRFTGEISGSNFTIHSAVLDSLFVGGINDCSGAYNPGNVKLSWQASNGQQVIANFSPVSTEHWNAIVITFRRICFLDNLHRKCELALRAHIANLSKSYQGSRAELESITKVRPLRGSERDELISKEVEARHLVESTKENLKQAQASLLAAEEAAAQAQAIRSRNSTNVNNVASNQANYAAGKARYVESKARYNLQNAEAGERDAEQKLEALNRETASDNLRTANDNEVIKNAVAEGTLIQTNAAVFKKFFAGNLWTASPTNAGFMYRAPRVESQHWGQYSKGQPLLVIPVAPDWCAVITNNSDLAWAQTHGISISEIQRK